jgi:hypothetical protein
VICNITVNTLNAELNPTYHLLALLGAHPILHISRIRVNIEKIKFFLEIHVDVWGGVAAQFHTFLISAINGIEWSVTQPVCPSLSPPPPPEKKFCTRGMKGRGGPER